MLRMYAVMQSQPPGRDRPRGFDYNQERHSKPCLFAIMLLFCGHLSFALRKNLSHTDTFHVDKGSKSLLTGSRFACDRIICRTFQCDTEITSPRCLCGLCITYSNYKEPFRKMTAFSLQRQLLAPFLLALLRAGNRLCCRGRYVCERDGKGLFLCLLFCSQFLMTVFMCINKTVRQRESKVWPSLHQAVGNAVLPSCPFKETLLSSKMAGSVPRPSDRRAHNNTDGQPHHTTV